MLPDASQVVPAVKKNSPANVGVAGDVGSVPRVGRSPGIGNGHPLQYSCLENSMDRGTAGRAVQSTESQRVGHN